MAMLIMNHHERSFFGGIKQMRQDTECYPELYDLEKCMNRVDNTFEDTFHLVVDNDVTFTYYYDTLRDYYDGIVTVKTYCPRKTDRREKMQKRYARKFFRLVLLNNKD